MTERNDISQHDIRIVRVDENGDIDFVLYGYMNRGQHEGQTGTAVYHYSAEQNAIEEQFFLRSLKSWEFLKEDMEKLAYVSKKRKSVSSFGRHSVLLPDGRKKLCDRTGSDRR